MLTETEAKSASLEFESETKEFLDVLGGFVKELLYDVYLQHQSSIKKNRIRSHFRTRLQLSFVLLQSLQLVSIILENCRSVNDYAEFKFVEDVLVSMRVDLWAEKMQKVEIAVIVSLSVLLMSIAALGVEMVFVRIYPEKRVHSLLKFTADLPAAIVHRLLLVPILLLYLRCAFDSLLATEATPYNALYLGFLGFVGLIGYGALIVLRICFLYESAWYQREHWMLARPNHSFELKEAAVYFLISLISSLRKSSEVSILLIGGLCLYLLFHVVFVQPYYNSETLLVKAVQYATLAWICISAETSIATDTVTTGICLVLFVGPCVGMLAVCLQRWRSHLIHYEKSPQGFWQYELSLRHLLQKQEKEEDAGEGPLMECWKLGAKTLGNQKAYFLVLAQYYYYRRELPEIALLRLAMTKGCLGGFLIDFQILRLCRAIGQLSKSEEREFVDFQSSYMKAKDLDQKLCENTCEILNILINRNTSSGQLERSFITLAKVIQNAKDEYRKLKQKYPQDPFLLESYGSFLDTLFHDKSGTDLMTRGGFEKTRRKKANINTIESYSSDDTGVLIISCDPDRFGKITYANEQLANILRCKVQDIIGKDLDDFIPPPYNYQHNNKLTSFLAAGEAKQIFRKNLFLSSMGRFSVEVTFRFRPTAVNNVPFFVTAVRQKPQNREFVIFNTQFTITSHSENFKKMLKALDERTNIVGLNLDQILPAISAHFKGREADPFLYYHPDVAMPLGAMYSQVELGSQLIKWLYVFTQVSDINDLFSAASNEALNQLRKELQSSSAGNSEEKPAENKVLRQGTMSMHEGKIKDQTMPTTNFHKETREEGSSMSGVHTSFALSPTGTSLRRNALRAVKTYKVSYLITMFLIATFISICLAIVYTTFHSLSQSNNIIDLGSSRMHLVKITHLVRRLNLAKQAKETPSPGVDLVQRLHDEIEKLGVVVNSRLQTREVPVPVWTLIQNNYQFTLIPLVTALSDFQSNAEQESNSMSSNVYRSTFFYVYSNGLTSLLKSLNSTVNQSLDNMKSSGFSIIAMASTVSFVLMSAVLIVSSVFITRSLWKLRKCYRVLWKCVVALPVTSIQETMQAHKDRLEYIHGEEYTASDQTKVKGNIGLLVPPNKWLPMLARASVFILMTSGFMIFLLLYGYGQVQLLLDSHTNYLNTKSITTFMPTLALTLLKETYLSSSSDPSYYNITGKSQTFYSLSEELNLVLATMSQFEAKSMRDTSAIAELSGSEFSSDLSLVLSNACSFVNASNSICEGSALAKGQHQGIMELRAQMLDLANKVGYNGVKWQAIVALEDYLDVLTEATEITSEKMQTYTVTTSETFVNSMLIYSCFYVLASAGLYIFVYLPMIDRLKRKCISVWRIATLIRHDLVQNR